MPINFVTSLGRSSVIVRVMGALAATASVYAAYASPATANDVAAHELPRAPHESSSAPPYSAILLDVNSGKVLHSVNADELRHPASLTKIMTLYLLFERLETGRLRLDTRLAVSEHAAEQAPTKLGLTPDQMITVEDAIGGLVTKSANDAATVIAEALAGDEHEFAALMTRKAHALGMSRTVYRNASGLPDDEQVTTARDQALLGRAIPLPRLLSLFRDVVLQVSRPDDAQSQSSARPSGGARRHQDWLHEGVGLQSRHLGATRQPAHRVSGAGRCVGWRPGCTHAQPDRGIHRSGHAAEERHCNRASKERTRQNAWDGCRAKHEGNPRR